MKDRLSLALTLGVGVGLGVLVTTEAYKHIDNSPNNIFEQTPHELVITPRYPILFPVNTVNLGQSHYDFSQRDAEEYFDLVLSRFRETRQTTRIGDFEEARFSPPANRFGSSDYRLTKKGPQRMLTVMYVSSPAYHNHAILTTYSFGEDGVPPEKHQLLDNRPKEVKEVEPWGSFILNMTENFNAFALAQK